jgi:hypothetical protein
VKRETIQRISTPTALIVGLSEALAAVCTQALDEGGLRVLRVGHVAAAAERIPVVMPQLVVVSTGTRPDDLETLTDRCVAVGADVVEASPTAPVADVEAMLREAANAAFIKALRRG